MTIRKLLKEVLDGIFLQNPMHLAHSEVYLKLIFGSNVQIDCLHAS